MNFVPPDSETYASSDPEPEDSVGARPASPVVVNLTADAILRGAERRKYREKLFGDITALFRSGGKKLELVRKPFVPDKRHGWLDIG